MLLIKEISKAYAQRGVVLDNITLEVNESETIAIMGPSGSGKTTLMNIIGLLDTPDSGEIFFRGSSLTGISDSDSAAYRSKNIGFVFQDHLLLPYLSVIENILLPLYSGNSKTDIGEETAYAYNLMERVGVKDIANKYPHQISGGEAQRVSIVRALINKPSLILADEPTGSLDETNAEILGKLLLEINRVNNVTIILATHSQQLARKMSKEYYLSNGKLILK